jgi:hypothetical protein
MKSSKHRYLTIILILFITALACDASLSGSGLRDYGVAEEIQGGFWIHVRKPLTLESLRGSVVLLSVWRFT